MKGIYKHLKNKTYYEYRRAFLLSIGILKIYTGAVLVSYPKSGRTWVRVMLEKLNVYMQYTHAGAGTENPVHYKKLTVPQAILEKKIIFLIRDPRDVIVSSYLQNKYREENYIGSISEFIRDERHGILKILEFYNIWNNKLSLLQNVLVVKYEDLVKNTLNELIKILNFLQIDKIGEEKIEKVIREFAFNKMQQKEKKGYFVKQYGKYLLPKDKNNTETYKVRRGKIGGYVDYLQKDDIEFIENLMKIQPNAYNNFT